MRATRWLRVALLAATAANVPVGSRAEDAESLNPMKAIDKAALDNFVQKPLFDPARQLPPPAPPVVFTAPPPPPPPLEPAPILQLLGVVRGRHDMAIVHKDGNEKTVVLRSGDKLGGWTVVVRPPVGVTLRNGDRKVDYAIFAKLGQGARPSAVPEPAPVFNAGRRRHSRDQE